METDSSEAPQSIRKWPNLRRVLETPGPYCSPNFTETPDHLEFLQNVCKVLVIGAGGLGCELLKDLALMGIRDIHVIDMDTVELSNLNRQFLFRRKDCGSSKAIVAAEFINQRVKGCTVTPHFCKIQDMDDSFYRQFHIVVSGLDSIVARRWINGTLLNLVEYNDDGTTDMSTLIPLIDGGTEGFKGNARVILPTMTACIDCTLDLFPPQITYPLCTIATTPRLPEHCVEYVKIIQWEKDNPFKASLDADEPTHVSWVYEKAKERADSFKITGLSYRLVQGVLKNIIPAVASTNAVIAAAMATEVFKVATECYPSLKNYMVFNDLDGIYSYTYEAERKADCLACSNVPKPVQVNLTDMTLQDLINFLCESHDFQLKAPALTTTVNAKSKTLYVSTIKSLEEQTKPHLSMTLTQLSLEDGQHITVADATTPNPFTIKLEHTQKVN